MGFRVDCLVLKCAYFWIFLNKSQFCINKCCSFQDIPTGAESCVTSMASDSVSQPIIVAGVGDGSVRIFDRRMPPNAA